jgi:hypothetical protein
MTPVAGCYLHFRCDRHVVAGHFEKRDGFCVACEVPGCERAACGYWYRGAQFQALPTN